MWLPLGFEGLEFRYVKDVILLVCQEQKACAALTVELLSLCGPNGEKMAAVHWNRFDA